MLGCLFPGVLTELPFGDHLIKSETILPGKPIMTNLERGLAYR
jgi:hypothetical protein